MGVDLRDRSPRGDSALLRLEGVTKHWGEHVVLDEVTLGLRPGVITGVVGANGVGKTTLMRVACGLVIPDGGTVRFRDAPVERDRTAFQRAVGLLSAGDRGLYARLTVRQNLDIWSGLAGLPRQERRSRIPRAVADFDLVALAERRVDRLSMGQRQRVRLAVTFLHGPLIVFLDEPRTSLDDEGVGLLAQALERHVAGGGTGLWVSHEPDEPLVAEQWLLRAGRLHRHGGAGRQIATNGVAAAPDDIANSVLAS